MKKLSSVYQQTKMGKQRKHRSLQHVSHTAIESSRTDLHPKNKQAESLLKKTVSQLLSNIKNGQVKVLRASYPENLRKLRERCNLLEVRKDQTLSVANSLPFGSSKSRNHWEHEMTKTKHCTSPSGFWNWKNQTRLPTKPCFFTEKICANPAVRTQLHVGYRSNCERSTIQVFRLHESAISTLGGNI